jgi:hypothetical protein
MEVYRSSVSGWVLGVVSVILGLVGAAFYWWLPMGIVISLSGLMAGFVGWAQGPRRSIGVALVVAGILLCIAALAFDSFIAFRGLETVRFEALR